MREIKFRAWDKNLKIMLAPFTLLEFRKMDYGNGYIERYFEPMQFCGLFDKNGKEIYEGDIIGLDDSEDKSTAQVCFVDGCFVGFVCMDEKFPDLPIYGELKWWAKVGGVIGNIYKNPELIKTGGK